jgi:hypothetical protein
MRKTIVYHYNDKANELNKELKPTHSKTLAYAFTRYHIAVNNLKLAIFDYDGKCTAHYNYEKYKEFIEAEKLKSTIQPRDGGSSYESMAK